MFLNWFCGPASLLLLYYTVSLDDVLEPPIGGIAQATLGSRGGAGELNAAAASGAIGTLNRSELETTLCVVGGDSHALNQFVNQLCVSKQHQTHRCH